MNITAKRTDVDARARSKPPRLLSGLTPDQRKIVLQSAELQKFPANAVIINSGDPASSLFLLKKGRVKYYRLTKKGGEVLIGLVAPGETFGLGTLLAEPMSYLGTAEAIDDCELFVWRRKQLMTPAATQELLGKNALHILMYYLAEFTDRLVGMTSETADQRLARTVLGLCRRTGHILPAGVEISITNEQLGGLANVSAFTASRQLKQWERQGVIQKRRGKMLIFNPELLLID